jgi:hypothetical protein
MPFSDARIQTVTPEDRPDQTLSIYQKIIDLLSYAALHGDLDILRRHIRLPFTFTTEAADFVLRSDAELVAYCMSFHETLTQMGATDYIRIAREARSLGPDRIEGVHYAHTIRNGHRLLPPFASRMIIERVAGIWAVTRAQHAITNNDQFIHIPTPAATSETPPPPFDA